MQSLTHRQQQILDMIRHWIETTGIPPTRADICEYFHFRSPTAAEDHLRALARKGAVKLQPGKSRGIQVVSEMMAAGLPVIGRVAAGAPILAVEHIEDHFDLDPTRFQPRADYLLRVRGHSMRDAGILNGDLLAVHRTPEARSGQIVIARVEDEVTVKRYRRKGYQVTLESENPDFAPIGVDLRDHEFAIEGLGVGVVRNRRL